MASHAELAGERKKGEVRGRRHGLLVVGRREAPWGGAGQRARARRPAVRPLLLCALLLLFVRKKRRGRERKGKEKEGKKRKKGEEEIGEKFKPKKL
jgi:hypothetical protein